MSTNNFVFKNICVVVHEDEDAEFTFEDDLAYWREELGRKFKHLIVPERRGWIGSHEALILAEVQFNRRSGEHYASVYATYKSGYYAAACLDYFVEYNEYDDLPKLKTLEAKIERTGERMKRILSKFGTRVVKVAQFSNGEAVYEKVKEAAYAN